MRKIMTRLVLGMVVAVACSLIVAFLAGCVLVTALTVNYPTGGGDDLGSIFVFGALVAWGASLFTVPAILILLVPLHRLAIRLGRVRGRDYAVAGALVGMCVYLAVQLAGRIKLLGLEFPGQMAIPALVIAPLLGAVAALGFWVVTRPDKARAEPRR